MSLLSNVSSVVDAGVMDHLPDPEVAPRAKPRSFAPAYKKKILAEIEGLDRTELGALLRREGLYSTLIRKWQGQAARDACTQTVGATRSKMVRHQPKPRAQRS